MLFTCSALLIASGAGCAWRKPALLEAPPPVAFLQPPSLQQVVAKVNANTDAVWQLQSQGATLAVRGLPQLQADIALERPRRFRLSAELTSFTGKELDIGSNDNLFWFWMKYNDPPVMYFARHQEYERSPVRNVMPVEPSWLIEALGLARFEPGDVHEGPYPAGEGRLEIKTRVASPQGELSKVTVVDATFGYVVEQRLFDAGGQVLASARASRHRYYAAQNASLPLHVEVELPPTGLAITVDVTEYMINQLAGAGEQLWAMPSVPGYPLVNLANPNAPTNAPLNAPTTSPPPVGYVQPTSYAQPPPRQPPPPRFQRPQYRGFRRLP